MCKLPYVASVSWVDHDGCERLEVEAFATQEAAEAWLAKSVAHDAAACKLEVVA